MSNPELKLSDAISEVVMALAQLQLPANATDAEINRRNYEVNRFSVAVGTLSALQRAQAHEANQADSRAFPFGTAQAVLAQWLAHDPDATVEQLTDRYDRWMATVLRVTNAHTPVPVPVPAPAPVDAPGPAPTPALPPGTFPMESAPEELSDSQAQWYFAQLMSEFASHNWPQTIEGAKEHWRRFGRPQGRKWAEDAPAPAWGPQAAFAPPGTRL